MTKTQKPGRAKTGDGFSAEERAAMKVRAEELKAEARGGKSKVAGEQDLLAGIAEMAEPDRAMAGRIHAVISEGVPTLSPRTWYGMPAWARDGKVVCFFQSGQKFKTRYSTFGFSDTARLDDGAMWPTAYALTELSEETAARILALVRAAVG